MLKENKYLYRIKNFSSVIYWRFLLLFGIKQSSEYIPDGHYCYSLERLPEAQVGIIQQYKYHQCKYYKPIGKHLNGCAYLGVITNDIIFDDQCKICGENKKY